MSSRKRKKATEAEAPETVATDVAEMAETEAEQSRAAELVPAVSQIKELRPREPDDAPEEPASEALEAAADGGEAEPQPAPPSAPKSRAHLKRVLESLIFVSDQIVSVQQLGRLVKAKQPEVRELLAELSVDYEGRGIELVEVAGGYQFRSAAACAPFVRDLVAQRPARLTRAQLETLALIAYRQPITRPEIDDVRGVDSGSAIKVLCERDLVKILGRKDEAGRPLLYGTTPFFLEFFGMNSMQDLPTLREFTELTDEHRELFQRKTGEIPDLSNEPSPPHADTPDAEEAAELAAEHDADVAAEAHHDADETDASPSVEEATHAFADDPTAPPESDNAQPHEDESDALS